MLQREGAETHGTYSQRFRSLNAPSVGLLSTGAFELRTAPACTDSAPPGLATPCRAAGPNEPGQSPTRLVSGYSLRLSVLPNAAIPPHPERGPQLFRLPSSFRVNHATTYWIYRSGLPYSRQKTSEHLRRPFVRRPMHPFKSTVDNCTGARACNNLNELKS